MRRPVAILAAFALAGVAPAPVVAQSQDQETGVTQVTAEMVPVDEYAAPVPFGPGERLTYRVKVGIFGVGRGHLTVQAVDTIREHPSYRVVMGIKGSLIGLGVDDEYTSWFDVGTLQSWRFVRDIHELSYKSYRHYEFYPDRRTWEREDNGETGPLGSALPLDDIAILYFVRQLPLEVGKSYTINRYFKEDGNPIVIHVARRDRRETAAGTFNTLVVRPVIKTDGMFSEGGEAELHFTDDERRLLVYFKTDIPNFPGSLTMHLTSIEEGYPLNPESRSVALEARQVRSQTEGAVR